MIVHDRIARAFTVIAVGIFAAALHAQGGRGFPRIEATSLAGRSLSFPADFGSPAALVFVAFAMKQQGDIDAWKDFVDAQRARRPALAVWELPTMGSPYKLMRGVIEGGMRSGITSQAARESTVTLYLDTKAFADSIGVPGLGEIAVLVVAPDGRILGRAPGRPDPASEASIAASIEAAFKTGR